ncbi:LacI family DNA-binding transcriptional regulator, partial [Pantoea agglomerans]|nr:LacI family DNA-binding transcriptional regulator [Pantoea agglomerans]
MTDLISVARLAGVSRATAARAFSDPHLLKPGTLQ